ncbi:MAG: hypothetical protein JW384_01592 [Nitrosomonadaceae bacterium]|jgi:hypothetical protein|nr:hypothetical protein [Nitrosomonadaceae bacterium]
MLVWIFHFIFILEKPDLSITPPVGWIFGKSPGPLHMSAGLLSKIGSVLEKLSTLLIPKKLSTLLMPSEAH